MKCRCGSHRIISVNGKTSDCCSVSYGDRCTDGYVPRSINIGGDDYIEFDYCLDCGLIQAEFPVPENKVLSALDDAGCIE